MPHDRFFINLPLTANDEVLLEDEEAHHLRVMRKQPLDKIELINGQNMLAAATISKIEKKRIVLLIDSVFTASPPYPIILAQAIPRLNRLDTIIEKGTELGVTTFWLFPGEKSEKKELKENDLLRLHRITISAIKQCGRLDLPELLTKPSLSHIGELPFPAYFGDTERGAPPFFQLWKKGESVLFFIGPEGGFSEKESLVLKNLNVKGVRLHPNVLRTDTAPLVALSLIQHWLMT